MHRDVLKGEMMRKPAMATSILIVLMLGGIAIQPESSDAQSRRCTLTIANNSRRNFHRLHISWSRDKDWGPNLLQNILTPGMTFTREGHCSG